MAYILLQGRQRQGTADANNARRRRRRSRGRSRVLVVVVAVGISVGGGTVVFVVLVGVIGAEAGGAVAAAIRSNSSSRSGSSNNSVLLVSRRFLPDTELLQNGCHAGPGISELYTRAAEATEAGCFRCVQSFRFEGSMSRGLRAQGNTNRALDLQVSPGTDKT